MLNTARTARPPLATTFDRSIGTVFERDEDDSGTAVRVESTVSVRVSAWKGAGRDARVSRLTERVRADSLP